MSFAGKEDDFMFLFNTDKLLDNNLFRVRE